MRDHPSTVVFPPRPIFQRGKHQRFSRRQHQSALEWQSGLEQASAFISVSAEQLSLDQSLLWQFTWEEKRLNLAWRIIGISHTSNWLAPNTNAFSGRGSNPGTFGSHTARNAQGRFQPPTTFFASWLFFHRNLHHRIAQSGLHTRTAVVSCFNCGIQGFRKGILDFVSPLWNGNGSPISPPHLVVPSSRTRKPSWAL